VPSEFVLVPRPGWDIREVARYPRFENAYIFEYRYGRLENIYPVNSQTLGIFKPRLPPEYYREEKVGKISLDKPLPDGYFATGVSPFVQVLYRKAVEMNGAGLSDLYKAVVSEYMIAPENKDTFEMVRHLVDWMAGAPSYLVRFVDRGRVFYRAGKPISGDPPLIPYEKGKNPIEDQVVKFVERRGITSYGDIKNFIIDRLGWLTSEAYLKDTLAKLTKNRNLVEVEKDYYSFLRHLDSF